MSLSRAAVLFGVLAGNAAGLKSQNTTDHSFLSKRNSTSMANLNFVDHGVEVAESPKCQCEHSNPGWKAPTRTNPKCIFIDLGAADGNTFKDFENNKYGPVHDCAYGTGDYEAFLVEANPRFKPNLESIAAGNSKVHAMPATAAYMCEGETSFFLDTTNVDVNYWGSSMSANHPDTIKSGHQKVTVPTSNLLKLIAENTIPDDYVIVKMDIEGAEWDILPCLSADPISKRIDRLFLEQHPKEWSVSPKTGNEIDASKAQMQQSGVDIPQYFSQTL